MKFLHISDLHLGKRVNEFSMIEDQKFIIDQILWIAEREQADAVLLSGDIYDRAVPPAEAVQLFDYFLTELAGKQKKVFAVSGNHDSAERIAFGARLMQGRGVYLSPVYDGTVSKITLTDEYGELFIYLLPFLKPAVVRHVLEREGEEELPKCCNEAVELVISRMGVDTKKRNILVAHQFVTGAGRCESEEVIVGGLDSVDKKVFDDFDYVALGHLHSPQSVGRETVRYCGTPLKYSFSEANQKKTVSVVEFKEKGQVFVAAVPLKPLHDMRVIRGSYLEVTAKDFYSKMDAEDYLKIILTDEEDILDGMQKLRIFYPNLMQLEYDNSRTKQNQMIDAAADLEQKTDLELFEEFYELQNNRTMSEIQREYFTRLLQERTEV